MKLEKKIIEKIYRFETKKTIKGLGLKILVILASGLVGGYFLGVVIYQLISQKTLDLFELFREDNEIIKDYFYDTIDVLYQEFPKSYLLLALFFSIIALVFILTIAKNFDKIKNKIRSIINYWRSH